MEKVVLSRQEYMDLLSRKPDFSGSEGNLYKKGKRLYKLYHNPYDYSEKHLEKIISFQPFIKRTRLPIGGLYFEKNFIGSILFRYVNASAFKTIYQESISFRIQKLRELSAIVQELTNNGLVLDDLYYGNIVITKERNIALIDTDGDNIQILENETQFLQFLRYLKGVMMECFQKELGISELPLVKLPDIEEHNLSYEALEQFLTELENNQKHY